MKKFFSRLILLLLLISQFLSMASLAAALDAQPEKPYEKVAAKLGSWYTDRLVYDGRSNLVIGFTGDYTAEASGQALSFKLSEKTVLSGVYVPYAGDSTGPVELYIVDSKGNFFQGFNGVPSLTGGLKEQNSADVLLRATSNSLYSFMPQADITLPRGEYTLFLEGNVTPVQAFLIKGYNASAYADYLDKLNRMTDTNEETNEALRPEDEVYSTQGDEDLWSLWQQFSNDDPSAYEGEWTYEPQQRYAPMFELESEMTLDTLILSMWNNGAGARPGTISLLDASGTIVAEYMAQGGSIGPVANALWTVEPKTLLPAGVYYIQMTSPEALAYDEAGEPVFYVGLSAPVVPVTNFTGTYKIWLDVFKTSTLMGPADGTQKTFFLEDYELSVLDKGSHIELIGIYEGMTFSQNCEVLDRTEDRLTAKLNFAADLTRLPYNAKISADAVVTLFTQPAGRIDIGMEGSAHYSRAASKDKGADENTYSLSLRGNRVKKDLPTFIMTALAKAGGAGNIPGPDTPFEAAVGILFPPLVGVIVSVLQNLLRPKETDKKPKEKEGPRSPWAILAEALANSDEPDDDPFSVGDNEMVSSSGSSGSDATDYESYESHEGSEDTDEDLAFGKPDTRDDTWQSEPEPSSVTPPETVANVAAEPESLVVTTSVGGAQTLIVRDPATGGWINAESGNPFDLEKHARDFPEQVKDYESYNKRRIELEATGQTSMQQALDRIAKERDDYVASIQKEIDGRRREQLERDQRWKESDMEMAQKLSGYGRIIGDTVRNIGDEFVETGKDIYTAGAYVGGKAVEGGIAAAKLMTDPKRLIHELNELNKMKDKMINNAIDELAQIGKDVYNNPEILSNTLKGSLLTGAKISAGIVTGIKETITDPKKAWNWVKENVGIENFENSLDPNRSLLSRIAQVGIGTLKLGTSLASAGKAAVSVSAKLGLGSAAGTAAKSTVAAGKALKTGTAAGKSVLSPPKGISPKLPVQSGPNFKTASTTPKIDGITQKSQKMIQNKADDMGLQVHTRPVTKNAQQLIDEGKAVPKGKDLKAKTIDIYDEKIGGPKNSEGKVGYFKPKMPPASELSKMTPDEVLAVEKRYNQRLTEYNKLSNDMIRLDHKYKVKDGLVVDVRTGKHITGDVDVYDITNFDGTPVSDKVKKMFSEAIMKEQGANIMHEDLISWATSDEAFDLKAKLGMMKDAAEGGKGVVTFNPLSGPTKSFSNLDAGDLEAVMNFLEDPKATLTQKQQDLYIKLIIDSTK